MKAHQSSPVPRPVPEESFRHRLQAELARRCTENPRYSLRAFAAALDVDHSTLSQLLRGRRRLTEETVRRLGRRLGLEDVEVARYVASQERLEAVRVATAPPLGSPESDAAEVLRGWEHLALLELVRLDGFRPDSRWIARVLGIEVDAVNLALQRLLRLGLLRMAPDGRWEDRTGDSVLDASGLGRAALRALVDEAGSLARRALERGPAEQGEHHAITFAVDSTRLGEVRTRLERLRDELAASFADHGPLDQVWRLDLHLYPLTRPEKPEQHEEPTHG